MTGTLVNVAAVIIGGFIGLMLKKALPERFKKMYFQAVGLFTLAIGISMIVHLNHILIIVSSLAIGSLIGEWMNLETTIDRWGLRFKERFRLVNEHFSEGLTTSFLLFCVGSMTIVGAIQEGTQGNSDLLLTKSLMDFFSAMILASAWGTGVIFAAVPLFIFQGSITLLSKVVSSVFTDDLLLAITHVGGILLIGLGINILEIKKIKVMNMLPSLVVVIVFIFLFV